jgi:hypothetical protein
MVKARTHGGRQVNLDFEKLVRNVGTAAQKLMDDLLGNLKEELTHVSSLLTEQAPKCDWESKYDALLAPETRLF